MDKLFIKPIYLEMVQTIFKKHCPNVKVLAYGSRVNGNDYTAHSGSDLDLAIEGLENEAISIFELKEFFQESNIPFFVDAFDLSLLPQSFHKEIAKNNIEIFPNFRGEYV